MTLFRMFILMGAVILTGFFSWPWVDRLLSAGVLSGEISLQAGGMTATVPAIMGLFATLGLAAMLWTVRR